MVELMFQRELMLIKQINQKNVSFYDIVQRSTDFKNIAIVYIKKSAYKIYFQHMTKHKAKKNNE